MGFSPPNPPSLPVTLTCTYWCPPPLTDAVVLQAGSKVVCVDDGLPTWVCELMVIKPTVQEAIDFIKSIEAQLNIPIVPNK